MKLFHIPNRSFYRNRTVMLAVAKTFKNYRLLKFLKSVLYVKDEGIFNGYKLEPRIIFS